MNEMQMPKSKIWDVTFVLCAGFTLLLGEDTPTSSLSGTLVRNVAKLASITF
jgi:hypothetical protein